MFVDRSGGGLTKTEEAKCPYQDHFFLVLCENLATSTMVRNGARTKELINLLCSKGGEEKEQQPPLGTEERVTRLTTP